MTQFMRQHKACLGIVHDLSVQAGFGDKHYGMQHPIGKGDMDLVGLP